jgi:pyruvate/2-oxoglutarate dehydrogenase complex dihydrolipoamide dehydrogenase (E3) component
VENIKARIAAADILGSEARSSYQAIPRCVFTDSEFVALGLTEKQASESGLDYAVVRVDLQDTVRPNLLRSQTACRHAQARR